MHNLNISDVINRAYVANKVTDNLVEVPNKLYACIPDEKGEIQYINAFEASSSSEIKRAKKIRDKRLKNII